MRENIKSVGLVLAIAIAAISLPTSIEDLSEIEEMGLKILKSKESEKIIKEFLYK